MVRALLSHLSHERLAYIGASGILASCYFLLAKFGLSLALINPSASPVWPATGFALAALVLFGCRYAPSIFIGALFANVTNESTFLASAGIALGNMLEGVVGAFLITTYANGRNAFKESHTTFYFVCIAFLAPIISATCGVLVLLLNGSVDSVTYWSVWLTWWLGDVGGALILAPFLLLWAHQPALSLSFARTVELAAALGCIVFVSYLIFGTVRTPFDFLLAPPLVWLIIRFRMRETATALMIGASLAIGGTAEGLGPFASSPPAYALLYLQTFLIVSALSAFLLSSVMAERRKFEQELKTADARKDDFLSMLSHELRNPLATMYTNLQLLQLSPETVPEKKHAVSQIEGEIRHTTALLEDLLDLSRIRRGRLTIRKEALNVVELVRYVADSVGPRVRDRGHALAVSCPESPLMIHADRHRMIQILTNLLTNAAKYTESGGTVRLTVQPTGNRVSIIVSDTGVGLSENELEELRTFDGSPSARHERSGLGIGLALVRRLVTMQDGTIEIASEGKGRGSAFTITFSLIEKAVAQLTNEFHLFPLSKPKNHNVAHTIVVADDNRDAADALTRLLRKLGHSVEVFYEGKPALERILQGVHVAILDLTFPDITGYDIAKKVHESLSAGSRPFLIAVTGYGMDDDLRRAREAGFDEHMTKPADMAVLQDILTRL